MLADVIPVLGVTAEVGVRDRPDTAPGAGAKIDGAGEALLSGELGNPEVAGEVAGVAGAGVFM
jgi:hypothetical protein